MIKEAPVDKEEAIYEVMSQVTSAKKDEEFFYLMNLFVDTEINEAEHCKKGNTQSHGYC